MKSFYILVSLMMILCAEIYGAGKKAPFQGRADLIIPDGEFLKYDVYHAGELVGQHWLITRYIDSNRVKVYDMNFNFDETNDSIFDYTNHYTNFMVNYTVNLKTASMESFWWDGVDFFVKNKYKGNAYMVIDFGREIHRTMKTYDGYDIREQKTVMKKVDSSFPVWDQFELQYGVRVMDLGRPGYFNQVLFMLKEPMSVSFKYMKTESIPTPHGDMEADKFMYGIGLSPGFGDRIVMTLFKQYIDSFYYWVEKGPQKRLIKFVDQMNNNEWILNSSGIWKD